MLRRILLSKFHSFFDLTVEQLPGLKAEDWGHTNGFKSKLSSQNGKAAGLRVVAGVIGSVGRMSSTGASAALNFVLQIRQCFRSYSRTIAWFVSQ